MKNLNLSFRQKKLIHILHEKGTYITGSELAKQLNVSPRTIRYDIEKINQKLLSYHAQILSKHSKGYIYYAEDPDKIYAMIRMDTSLLTSSERIRFLALKLCLSDVPLNLYDLEEEMYVSHTTIENDLSLLKKKYSLKSPYIRLIRKGDMIYLEPDEGKIRQLLSYLFFEDWNYNKSENIYYDLYFIEKDIIDDITGIIADKLHQFEIFMEDPSLVILNLSIAIMYYRIKTGHLIPDCPVDFQTWTDKPAAYATFSIFHGLREHFHLSFSLQEQEQMYQIIISGRLFQIDFNNFEAALSYFSPCIRSFADEYLKKIYDIFQIDFSGDKDFYLTLMVFLRQISMPVNTFTMQDNKNLVKKQLLIECEIAWLIEDLSLKYFGNYIHQTELLYLAHCFFGALNFLQETFPDTKFRTVICCHLNMPAAWTLKKRIEDVFNQFLTLVKLLPVNAKDNFDFSNIDFVISTAHKRITDHPGTKTIYLNSIRNYDDFPKISQFIREKQLDSISFFPELSVKHLLEDAFWHEHVNCTSRFEIIELLVNDFMQNMIVTEAFLTDILRRESLSSNALNHGLIFLHSLIPAKETKFSIALLSNPLTWNTFTIHIVVIAAFRPEHRAFVFRLLNYFYTDSLDIDKFRHINKKEDLIKLFS